MVHTFWRGHYRRASQLVALFMIFRRGSIQSWSDGLVMGGFIGLGFAAFEDLIYAINGDDAFATLISRGIFSIFAHTFFSGLGATIIVFGLLTRRKWLSFLGFLAAVFLHLTWNTILAFEIFSYASAGFFFFYSFLSFSDDGCVRCCCCCCCCLDIFRISTRLC